MASPAQRQVEANAEVERIAEALYEEVWHFEWAPLTEVQKDVWRGHVRALLNAGAIRPPVRTQTEPPMEGQTTIDEQLGGQW